MNASEIRIAIAGCGRIAFELEADPLRYKPCTHLGALRHLAAKDRRLVTAGFCDPNLARANAAAEYMVHGGTEVLRAKDGESKTMVHGGTEVLRAKDGESRNIVQEKQTPLITDDASRLLALKPDLLVIAASTAAHFQLLGAALKAKVPRIIIEKPVAFSAKEAKKLQQLVLKSNSVILPNYERRYHPKYIRLKKRITAAGQPLSYHGFFAAGGKSLYAEKNGDEGVLLHDTTHLLDLAQYLFGSVKKHTIVAGKKCHVLHLEHAGGATGLIETNLGIGVFHLELEIRLADRRITVGNGFETTEKIAASRYYRNLKSYHEPRRVADTRFAVAKNPFVQLYREALYGRPDNAHFYEALDNVVLLTSS